VIDSTPVLGYIVVTPTKNRGNRVVATEEYAGLGLPPTAIRGVTAVRKSSGQWKLRFDLDVTFPLPDGRSVRFDRAVTVTGQQKGRKPEGSVPPRAKKRKQRTP
jgi:hypothetical protein